MVSIFRMIFPVLYLSAKAVLSLRLNNLAGPSWHLLKIEEPQLKHFHFEERDILGGWLPCCTPFYKGWWIKSKWLGRNNDAQFPDPSTSGEKCVAKNCKPSCFMLEDGVTSPFFPHPSFCRGYSAWFSLLMWVVDRPETGNHSFCSTILS